MTRRRRNWLLLAVVVGIGVLGAGAMLANAWKPSGAGGGSGSAGPVESGSSSAPQRASASEPVADEGAVVTVTVVPVRREKVQRSVQVVGSFSGYDEVTVAAEVPGRVTKIRCEVGDVVRPGDVLLEIDPTDYELAVQEARTALEIELAKLLPDESSRRKLVDKIVQAVRQEKTRRALMDKLAQAGPSALVEGLFDIESVPAVRRAKQQEENARSNYERAKQLHKKDVVSQELLEQLETAYEVARNTSIQTRMEVQATVASACFRAATLATAEHKLKNTKVVVPESTVAMRAGLKDVEYSVARRRVDEGEMVKDSPSASMAAFDLVIDTLLKFRGAVPERYVGEVRVGQEVVVHVEAYPDKVFKGKLTRVSPVVDSMSRTFQVEAEVPNPNRELKPGGFGKADILTHIDPNALVVPIEAVVSFAGSTKVFVVRNDVATAVPVMLGASGRGWVELAGVDPNRLAPGTLVVTSGQDKLADGSRIRVRDAAATGK